MSSRDRARSATYTVLPLGAKKPSCAARPTVVREITALSYVRMTVTLFVVTLTTSR